MSDKNSKFGSLYENKEEDGEIYLPPNPSCSKLNSMPGYQQLYAKSLQGPDKFWLKETKDLYFEKKSNKGLEYNFDVNKGKIFTKFMDGSTSNLSYNCLERIIAQGKGKKVAYKFEGNEPSNSFEVTYNELHAQVVKCSAVLRSKGVKKGDVVAIYLPMIIELPVSMLACSRIGATHAVVFAGFSAEAVAERLIQANARFVITADAFARGPKIVKLKDMADEAVKICIQRGHTIKYMLIVEHVTKHPLPNNQKAPKIQWNPMIDCKWDEEMKRCEEIESPVEWVDAEHDLFVLYTSGSTGHPKGIVHSTIGYMTYVYSTMKSNLCSDEDDVYWCTADCGWITGHSYVVYGPLLTGKTSILFEGIPTYPAADRMWKIVEKYNVTTLYTAPTAIRALMAYPEHLVTDCNLTSLKIIGTVGEPLNAQAWKWLYNVVGEKRCSVIDTFWQTECGGHMISAIPGVIPMKPGSAGLACFGINPILLSNEGKVIEGAGEGNLCFDGSWPGISRTVLRDHERFLKVYFSSFPGYYFTGDTARRDEDGYYWIQGRVDDLMNVSGHLLSTAEIEAALTMHKDVVEAAVVAAEHPIKGHFPYAFIVTRKGKNLNETMINELKVIVRQRIGAIAIPDKIQQASGLPKTRSGKITRRILRKVADGDRSADLGDTSTLLDVKIIDELWISRVAIPIRAG